MIWDHSEQELQDFISKIKKKNHETIKCTFNCSKTETTFLDIDIKMKENGELETSVYEKITKCHQCIEFSHHVILCRVNRVSPIVRLNVINVLHQTSHIW